MNERRIKVLVVEDSNVIRMFLVHLLNSDPQLQVIGTAANGREALEFLERNTPDVVLMDIEMPEMDGFEATRRIMETRPLPIVICTGSSNPRETISTFRLMEVGAVSCVEKPLGTEHKDFEAMASQLLQTLKLMSEVKVVRRWPRSRRDGTPSNATPVALSRRTAATIDLVGIGASTGGPPVLQTILSALPKDFPVPLLVVQHIAPGFVEGLADWLNQTTGTKVHIAAYGIQPLPGHVYLAPDDFHMAISAGGKIVLNKTEPESGLRPSVDHLFRSIADIAGANAVGVLLTGMGRDGARELKRMKDRGATTLVQDRESSVVHGMPGEAIALDAATHILSADAIGPALLTLVNRKTRPSD
jgi:two-component system chemotaxis response regulator CheB